MQARLDYKALGLKIRRKRKALGLSQEQFAKEVGVSLSFLGHIERGDRKPSAQTLFNIALSLETTLDNLMYDSFPPGSYGRVTIEDRGDLFSQMKKMIHDLEIECKTKRMT